MKSGNKLKVTMLFPIYDNEGHPVEEEIWDWWVDEINKILFAGGTDSGLATGWWHGKKDVNRWIWAIVDEDKLSEIREFLETAKGKFGQKKMYLDYHQTTYEEIG